jgi:3,4-dihydroxy 2-butanone 4-phosphate synthase/GTP cyclohydrolase II
VGECEFKNHIGKFNLIAYRDHFDQQVHFAVVKGNINAQRPTLVRVHMPHYLNDVLGIEQGQAGWPLEDAMHQVEEAEEGVIVLLSRTEEKQDIVQQIQRMKTQDSVHHMPKSESSSDLRTYGIGAQILLDLGVRKMRVMSAPKRLHGLSGFGLEVVEYVGNK